MAQDAGEQAYQGEQQQQQQQQHNSSGKVETQFT
jgi:hypothetical protein